MLKRFLSHPIFGGTGFIQTVVGVPGMFDSANSFLSSWPLSRDILVFLAGSGSVMLAIYVSIKSWDFYMRMKTTITGKLETREDRKLRKLAQYIYDINITKAANAILRYYSEKDKNKKFDDND